MHISHVKVKVWVEIRSSRVLLQEDPDLRAQNSIDQMKDLSILGMCTLIKLS